MKKKNLKRKHRKYEINFWESLRTFKINACYIITVFKFKKKIYGVFNKTLLFQASDKIYTENFKTQPYFVAVYVDDEILFYVTYICFKQC